jgi:hypothetical protein
MRLPFSMHPGLLESHPACLGRGPQVPLARFKAMGACEGPWAVWSQSQSKAFPSQCRTMGNFVLPKKFTTPQTRLFAKNIAVYEYPRRAVECYSNFWVRTRPRKTPPFYHLEGSLFLLKKRLAGGEQLKGT